MNCLKHIHLHTLAQEILDHATMIWNLEPNFVKDEETYKRKIDHNINFLERDVKDLTIYIEELKKDENMYYTDPDEETK